MIGIINKLCCKKKLIELNVKILFSDEEPGDEIIFSHKDKIKNDMLIILKTNFNFLSDIILN